MPFERCELGLVYHMMQIFNRILGLGSCLIIAGRQGAKRNHIDNDKNKAFKVVANQDAPIARVN